MFSLGEWNHAVPHDVDGTNWMFSLGEWNHLTALGIAAAFPAITDAAATTANTIVVFMGVRSVSIHL
jgi:hypothetical protein